MELSDSNSCILLAGVCGSALFHDKLGDTEAHHAVDRCFNRIERATAVFKGQVVKTIGDELVALFESAEDALLAACEMQQRIEDLPPASGLKMAIRVVVHFGDVLIKGDDIVGDAFDLSKRLAKLANPGQIIATAETVAMLPPALRKSARKVTFSGSDGNIQDLGLYEVSQQDSSDMPMFQTTPPPEVATISWLRLRYGEQELVLNQFRAKASLGRGINCDIIIRDPRASRSHALIERRRGKFVLIDQSANGTFVGVVGESEIILKHEETVLRDHGYLSFGHHSGDGRADVVEFEVMTEQR